MTLAFTLYRFLTTAFSPFICLHIFVRLKQGKEDKKRFKERFGSATIPRPKGKLVWLHAASVGESVSVLPLLKKLTERFPDIHILVTTGTVTSANVLRNKLPERAFHQYVPIDIPFVVRRFLKHWQPDTVLWVESELWPNMIIDTAKRAPMLLINGRISPSSFKVWSYCRSLARKMLRSFSFILVQSEHDKQRFQALGAPDPRYLGNLKFDCPSLPADSKEMGDLLHMIGQRYVWVAASTHSNEEEMLAEVHDQLSTNWEGLLTIIIPRHPNRGDAIREQITQPSRHISQRSKHEPITEETNIYIADTIGELGIFYRLAPIVFIGGSLVPHGGQNPLEAARLDCAILYGPHMHNFTEITEEFERRHASIPVATKEELCATIDEIMQDHERQEALIQASKALIEEKTGLVDKIIEEIHPFIAPSPDL